MTRRHEGFVTAALATVAVVAIGCSDTKPATKVQDDRGVVGTTFAPDGKPKEAKLEAPGVIAPASFTDGETAFEGKNYGEAARIFASYTEKHPQKAIGHYMLGLSSWKAGNAEGAEKAFEEALVLDPKHLKSLLNLSRVLIERNRASDAVAKLVTANELAPESGEVARLLGRAYHTDGKFEDAIASYRRAIELDENDSWAMNNLGLVFFEQGRAGDALPLFNRAVELNASVATFHNNLGMALEHAGRFDDAKTAYAGALTADTGYVKAQQNLARVEKVKVAKEPADLAKGVEPVAEQPEVEPTVSLSR
jgi:Flp pilus assembly protein TadD